MRAGMTVRGRWTACLVAGSLLLAGCASSVDAAVVPATPGSTPSATPTPEQTEAASTLPDAVVHGAALAAAQALPVKGRAPKTGYDRDLFGSGWVDVDRNGCDTRNDILSRDLTGLETKPGTGGCVVLRGVLQDPFGGATIAFVRGNTTSTAVQIDHVVALSDAWQKGAQGWTPGARVAFANDPLNLLAVDGPLNASKGDGDAATWLPPRKDVRCAYVARQVAVKAKYGAWVTGAERDAMVRVLTSCPGEPLPAGAHDPIVAVTVREEPAPPKPEPTQAPKPSPKPSPEPASQPAPTPVPSDVYYKNCTAARDAGAAPVHKGEPGYARHLDRDGDGVGCE